MENENNNWPEKDSAFKSPWLRGIIALIAIFFSVNIYMAWTAFSTKPNLVTPDYYKRGQSFTERTKVKNRTKAILNWEINLAHEEIVKGKPSLFTLSITAEENIIRPIEVTFLAYRPSDSKKDFKVSMNSDSDGYSTANVTFTEQGYWDLIIVITHNDYETDYAQRIFVKSH